MSNATQQESHPFLTGAETAKVVKQEGALRIERMTVGHAYPRSGNFHNPTPRYTWTVFRGERRMGSAYSLKAAMEIFEDCK